MEPRIQYAKTTDGVSIAFWTMGEGPPLIIAPAIPYSHIQREWQWPGYRAYYEALMQGRRLVRYDGRGSGLSDRDVNDYSLDAHLLDLEAVVDRVGLERFALFGPLTAGPVVIAYAARRPQRVSHLILWASYARASDYFGASQVKAIRKLRDEDWEIYTETAGHVATGFSQPDEARWWAGYIRESVTQEALQAAMREAEDFDVSDMLGKVESPTLVIHPGRAPYPSVDVARGLASGIPNAHLVVLEDTAILPWVGDMEAAVRAIDELRGEGEEAPAGAEGIEPGAFRTVLFTDVEGSTALTQRLGDAKARKLLREHERMVREALKAHGGSEFKTMGDGFMTSFSAATKALECAIAMQEAFADRNESAAEPIRVRIGLNAGEPIAEDDPDGRSDLYGTAVNLAARIAAEAKGGEILASNVVRELVAGKEFLFADRGEVSLKGFDEPVRLY
ncbi:MAG: adenylate/guanylate cyclase domain-containing protein, partial [Dehalococcoidia bacterium]